jgi:sulfur-oxidizing protein SoxY
MMMLTRRKFIQGTTACGLAACFLVSPSAFADWPSAVFAREKKNDVLKDMFGTDEIEPSSLISIKAPEIAENGAVVPVKIEADLPGVESISLLVDKNPRPLAAQFVMPAKNNGSVGTRIKLAEQSDITVVVKANGKLYSATKFVKVTKGGCGG